MKLKLKCSQSLATRHYIKSSIILLVMTILMTADCSRHDPAEPIVEANGEQLHGVWASAENQIAVFKGVPFAAPPTGRLRWRAPVQNQPRPGPQDAKGFASACMQTPYITDWYGRVASAFGAGPEVAAKPVKVSEDCLYLNVWSPRLDPVARLPVMVWVHGGSNKGGWSYEPNTIGTALAAKGVVVVSIAYRLGPFGFFSHPALANGSGEPNANFGWLDTQQALQWVADNISVFGGDAENITGFGESSGAGDLSDWLIANLGKTSLVKRAILQSPANALENRRNLAAEQGTGTQLIDSLGIKGEISAARLREIPAWDLVAAADTALVGFYFDAVIDGLTMHEQPIESLRNGSNTHLDVLIGSNADEWYMYIDANSSRVDLERWTNANTPQHVQAVLAEVAGESDARRALDRVRTAKDTLCPSHYLAGKVSELGGRSWVYYFTRQRQGVGGDKLGAYHGTEIPYVFNQHDAWLLTQATDHAVTDAVMDYWVQFARSGDPNVPGRPVWPVYSAADPMVMELGANMAAMKANDARLCELLGPDRTVEAGE